MFFHNTSEKTTFLPIFKSILKKLETNLSLLLKGLLFPLKNSKIFSGSRLFECKYSKIQCQFLKQVYYKNVFILSALRNVAEPFFHFPKNAFMCLCFVFYLEGWFSPFFFSTKTQKTYGCSVHGAIDHVL